jgi:hypothetical protein
LSKLARTSLHGRTSLWTTAQHSCQPPESNRGLSLLLSQRELASLSVSCRWGASVRLVRMVEYLHRVRAWALCHHRGETGKSSERACNNPAAGASETANLRASQAIGNRAECRRFTPFSTPLLPKCRRRTIENGGKCESLRIALPAPTLHEIKRLLSFSDGQRPVLPS